MPRSITRASGSRPGFSRPVGSNSVLDPPVQVRPPRASTGRARRRLGGVDDARRRPRPRTGRCRPSAAGAAARAPSGAATSGAAAAAGGPADVGQPGARRPRPSTSAGWPSSSTHVVVAVPQHRRPAGAACARSANGSAVARQPPLGRRQRPGAQHDLGRCSPRVPSEPTSSRHRSKPLTFFTVGPPALTSRPSAETYADLEQRVAHRSPAEPAEPAAADGEHAADRRARPGGQGHASGPRSASAASRSATVVPAPHPHGHLGRLERRRCRPAAAPRGHAPGRPARRRPTACGRRRATTGPARRPDLGRERGHAVGSDRHTHSALGDGLQVAAADAGGQHLRRVGHAVGVERLAQPGLGVEVVGAEQQRHEVALLEPDAVLARQHAAGGERGPHDLVARGVHPLHHARLAGVEQRAAGGGCRRRRGRRSSRRGRGARRSRRPRSSTSTSRVRGTTVSCR